MARDELILHVIPKDYTVELIRHDGRDTLFGAIREGGSETIAAAEGAWQTHTCGVWHFVAPVHPSDSSPIQRFGIRQWHVPRYQMAEALESLRLGRGETAQGVRSIVIGDGLAIGVDGNGKVFLVRRTLPDRPIPLLPRMVDAIDGDIRRLHAARSRVAAKDGLFSFGGIRTNAGHKIRHKSRQLVEAIAFETETLPSLKAGNFGIYSAFCTYRDFRLSKDMPDDLMEMLVIGQLSYDLSDVSDEVMEMFLETQRRLLPQPIWGTGIDVSKSDATRILGEGMRKLPREKRVQFVLMNGMHNSGLFLPLAAITGCIDFEQYVQYMNQGSPPDSGEEQDRRKQVAFIALYGAIAANRPHPF